MAEKKKKDANKEPGFFERKMKSIIKMDDYGELLREDIFRFIRQYDNIDAALDVGCGFGTTNRYLKAMGCKKVYGIDIRDSHLKIAEKYSDEIYNCDVEKMDIPFEKKSLDYINFGDVLEHLYNPLLILKKFRETLKDDGFITVSLPNIRHFTLIIRLILGRWEYRPIGLLDETHIRFFTAREMINMFRKAGFEVVNARATLFEGAMKQVFKMVFKGFPNDEKIARKKQRLEKYKDKPLRYKKSPAIFLWPRLMLYRLIGFHAYQYVWVLKKSDNYKPEEEKKKS